MHLTISPYFWLPNQDGEYIQLTWDIAAMILNQKKLSRIIMQLRSTAETNLLITPCHERQLLLCWLELGVSPPWSAQRYVRWKTRSNDTQSRPSSQIPLAPRAFIILKL
jgi:hypothetical protein